MVGIIIIVGTPSVEVRCLKLVLEHASNLLMLRGNIFIPGALPSLKFPSFISGEYTSVGVLFVSVRTVSRAGTCAKWGSALPTAVSRGHNKPKWANINKDIFLQSINTKYLLSPTP